MNKLLLCCAMVFSSLFCLDESHLFASAPDHTSAQWVQAGWGGGGYFYSAAFHSTRNGVIYLAGDVGGVYKSDDGGRTWRMINNGIAGYGVFSLAVDPQNGDTLFAATESGLSKSTDAGESWHTIPRSGPKELRLTGEKKRAIHNVAIDPGNGNIVYMGTAHGKIYKSIDGGQTWTLVHEVAHVQETVPSMCIQFGGRSTAIFGGLWMPVKLPASLESRSISGIGFSLKCDGAPPRDIYLTIRTSTGCIYRSRNLHDDIAGGWHDVVLSANDFVIDPEFKAKHPQEAAGAPAQPDWPSVIRFDFSAVGGFENKPMTMHIGRFYFATPTAADGLNEKVTLVDMANTRPQAVHVYGNIHLGELADGPVYSVAVSRSQPGMIVAATSDEGLLLSTDAGQAWRAIGDMKPIYAVALSPADPDLIYAACGTDHIRKSTDRGVTWSDVSAGVSDKVSILDIVISPADPNDVYAIGNEGGWGGRFFASHDAGKSWNIVDQITPDPAGNPTLPAETANHAKVGLSGSRNLAINPLNPKQLFIAANWRSVRSDDAGRTWTEHARRADITCITDIRFHNNLVYVSAMDEGVLVSDDNGENWKQLWPLRYSADLSGHYWRLDVRQINGQTRIISTSSPWSTSYNQVVISNDGGATFHSYRDGLPKDLPTVNTMWGRGYPRALAVDPQNPNIVYLGIDGDPTPGKSGGGIFKSENGGQTWTQLPDQPDSRRMFYGLAVDPTDSNRLYWAACASRGGIYRSDDGGNSWRLICEKEHWVFNLHVTADGTLYYLAKNIYRSTDHGQTWTKLAKLPGDGTVVGFEVHPSDSKILWAVANTWSGEAVGGVYKTTDGGSTWTDITGNLPFRKPLVLRFNPQTNELWAGGVGLYRIRQ